MCTKESHGSYQILGVRGRGIGWAGISGLIVEGN